MWADRITIAVLCLLIFGGAALLAFGPIVGLATEDASPPQCHEVRC